MKCANYTTVQMENFADEKQKRGMDLQIFKTVLAVT